MLKHAFLIMAHNEFSVLEKLVSCLDDERNDIYIHFDKKLLHMPNIEVFRAGLHILVNRVNVYWGDVSVITAEYNLFEAAVSRGPYNYYHLLSGVDLPLKSMDELHVFFHKYQGREFIGFTQGNIDKEIDRKVRRTHLYSKFFRIEKGLCHFFRRGIRAGFLRLQFFFGLRRRHDLVFRKGSQWVSLTDNFLRYVLYNKNNVLKTYKKTFCSDEIFLQTLCWNSHFRLRLFDVTDERQGCQRIIRWKEGELLEWSDADFEMLIGSDMIFARKFSSRNSMLLDRLVNHIKISQ